MPFEMWDLIPEQERLSNKKNIDRICKLFDINDIYTSRHSLKRRPPRGNTMDPEKENKQYLDQLGARKDDQMMNQWTEDNVVQRKIISEWTYPDQLRAKTIHASELEQ
jgi:hypothetical protein